MNTITIGGKITKLRKEKGLTQSRLAEMLNVSNKAISRWETGEGYPETSLLVPLANALGVSVDFLLNEEHKPDSQTSWEPKPQKNINETGSQANPEKKCVERKAERFAPYPPQFIRCFRSLTIFNKISFVTAFIGGLSLVFSVILIMLRQFPTATQLSLFSILALRVGACSAALGCLLGFIDVYDRQYRAGVYLLIANVALGIIIPSLVAFGSWRILSILN